MQGCYRFLSITENLSGRLLRLSMYADLEEKELEYIVGEICRILLKWNYIFLNYVIYIYLNFSKILGEKIND